MFHPFPEVKNRFGFGCMRLPMKGDQVNHEETCAMVDAFLEAGFNYFDTAHGYINEMSEPALKACLTSRYPRERYLLTDKLTYNYFNTPEEVRPFFQLQLDQCGVEYFDFYLIHAVGKSNYEHYKKCRAFEQAFELKKEGKIRHVGFSFHDQADFLDQVLQDYPETEVVQIQFNYADYEDSGVQSRLCYEVCVKHGKPCIIMEPVKGGSLVNLPADAQGLLDALHSGSPASYALRFCASFENNFMTISGMSNMAQMKDNIATMKDFTPLSDSEQEVIRKVQAIFHGLDIVPCTGCQYCVPHCPQHIKIPDLFNVYNRKKQYNEWNQDHYYHVITQQGGKASDCIKCGRCMPHCPQHLKIPDLLVDVAGVFDKPQA